MRKPNWNKVKAITLGALESFGSIGAFGVIVLGWLIWMITKHTPYGVIEILIGLILLTVVTFGGFRLYEWDQKKKGKWDV